MIEMMFSSYESAKQGGSYFLFYILALGLGLAISWDRYSKTEAKDNWMLEEAKQKIQLWPFLYGLCSLFLVVANPLAVWVINRISPLEGRYFKLWALLLFTFLSSYAIVCFLSLLREENKKVILLSGFIVLIGLGGNFYGLLSDRSSEDLYEKEQQVIAYLQEENLKQKEPTEEIRLLAPEEILEFAGIHAPGIKLIYGKDLYTQGLDLGIIDAYDPGLLLVYEAMKEPAENLEIILEAARYYDCNALVLSPSENLPGELGNYKKEEIIGDYVIYR